MNLKTDFKRLVDAVAALGIDVSEYLHALEVGVETTSEAEYVAAPDGFYDVLPTGDIVRLLIHISQGGHTRCYDDPARWHRYHTAKCTAYGPPSRQLKQFKTRRSDGKFTYFIYDLWNKEYGAYERMSGRSLKICGHCLAKLDNLALLDEDGQPDLQALLSGELSRRLHLDPIAHDYDRIYGFTAEDWHRIAHHVKNRASWHCMRCAIDLRCTKRFLHAHYRPSIGQSGLLGRVVPLCAGCHALEKGHEALRFKVRSGSEFSEFHSEHASHKVFGPS